LHALLIPPPPSSPPSPLIAGPPSVENLSAPRCTPASLSKCCPLCRTAIMRIIGIFVSCVVSRVAAAFHQTLPLLGDIASPPQHLQCSGVISCDNCVQTCLTLRSAARAITWHDCLLLLSHSRYVPGVGPFPDLPTASAWRSSSPRQTWTDPMQRSSQMSSDTLRAC